MTNERMNECLKNDEARMTKNSPAHRSIRHTTNEVRRNLQPPWARSFNDGIEMR